MKHILLEEAYMLLIRRVEIAKNVFLDKGICAGIREIKEAGLTAVLRENKSVPHFRIARTMHPVNRQSIYHALLKRTCVLLGQKHSLILKHRVGNIQNQIVGRGMRSKGLHTAKS